MWNMKNLNPSTRFYYDEKKVEWIDLRLVPEAKYTEFRKQLDIKQKRVREYDKKGQPVLLDTMDNSEEKMMSLIDLANDYMIDTWHLVTEEGKEIPCTPENKKTLISGSPDFAAWLDKCVKELKKDKEEKSEEAEKN